MAAVTGSLAQRVPAGLFDRARAELRAAATSGGFPALAGGSANSVLRRAQSSSSTGFLAHSTAPDGASQGGDVAGGTDAPGTQAVSEALSSREWDQLVEEVVRRIESRVGQELARRGRRFTPKAF